MVTGRINICCISRAGNTHTRTHTLNSFQSIQNKLCAGAAAHPGWPAWSLQRAWFPWKRPWSPAANLRSLLRPRPLPTASHPAGQHPTKTGDQLPFPFRVRWTIVWKMGWFFKKKHKHMSRGGPRGPASPPPAACGPPGSHAPEGGSPPKSQLAAGLHWPPAFSPAQGRGSL